MDPVQALRDRIDTAPRPDPWKVRCARALRYMTQEQLGIACGWSSVQKEIVNRIEAYAEPIGKLRIAKLAAALNVTPDDLLSSPVEWRANREQFDVWAAEGRPDLAAWVKGRGGQS